MDDVRMVGGFGLLTKNDLPVFCLHKMFYIADSDSVPAVMAV